MSDLADILYSQERGGQGDRGRWNEPGHAARSAVFEAAIARSVRLAREAAEQGGIPDAAWSLGEKLMTALVFQSAGQLEALGYSEDDAVERLRYDYGASTEEFPRVLARIRAEL